MFIWCILLYFGIGFVSWAFLSKIDIQLGRKYLEKACSPGGEWSHFSDLDKEILLNALKNIEGSVTLLGHLWFWPIRVPFLIVRYYRMKD